MVTKLQPSTVGSPYRERHNKPTYKTKSLVYGQLILAKKLTTGRGKSNLQQMVPRQVDFHRQKMGLSLCLTAYAKINSRGWREGWAVTSHTTLAKDRSSVPGTNTWQLTPSCTLSSGGGGIQHLCPPPAPVFTCADLNTDTSFKIIKIKF